MSGQCRKLGLPIEHQVGLSSLTSHVLAIALANKIPVRYAYRLMGRDAATVAASSQLEIVSDGAGFAEQRIRGWLDSPATVP